MGDAVDDAVVAGKIAPGRAAFWRALYSDDPAGTGRLLAEMAARVIPTPALRVPPIQHWHPWNDPCRLCGGGGYWQTKEDPPGTVRMWCGNCGQELSVVFTPWRGTPVLIPVSSLRADAGWIPEGSPALPQLGVIEVHCGPPAYYPDPPSPEEILGSAYWLTLPGPGRADLSDHRVYDFYTAARMMGAGRG